MLSRYFDQLKQLSELLSHGRDFDFNLWLKTIKLTALILAQSIGFLIVFAIFIIGPVFKWRNIWRNVKIAYWICVAIIYVLFAIPTVLLFL